MAINKNHEFEELDGVKCAVVERNVSRGRVDFIEALLRLNGYTVVVVPAAPPKTAAPAAGGEATAVAEPEAPSLFTVGVTDVSFNQVNAIFGRLLKTQEGRVVTLAFWKQQDNVSRDETPYFENSF